ncbi:MAG: TRAM domain-containing protein, partial [Eubacteriales bacterium]|nr:TRAM domain-containing protein [Eubacteriales bacterium]
MKKGDVIQGRIEQLNFPNKGVMRTPEGSCVVKNTLPGQLVSVRVTKRRQGRAEGRLLEVLEPAPDEIVPPCAQFGICGGCAYLNLPYEKTLELKEIQVRRLLEQALVNA